MQLEDLVIAVASGGSVGAALQFTRFLIQRRDRRRDAVKRWEQVLVEKRQITAELNRLVAETPADRACIARVENGGDIPAAGHPLWSSLESEIVSSRLPQKMDDWQRVLLDSGYRDVLREVMASSAARITVADLDPDSKLGLYLSAQGVQYAEAYDLYRQPGAFFLLQLDFKDRPAELRKQLTPGYREHVRVARQRISEVLKKSAELSGKI